MNKDYIQTIGSVKKEIKKAVVGKDDVIDKTLMAILSGGHILLDDIPSRKDYFGSCPEQSPGTFF